MEDIDCIETAVRRIVEFSDVNIITKRMVRKEYKKLTGATSLSTAEKRTINQVLDKIVYELAMKTQLLPPLDNTTTDSKRFQKEEAVICDVRLHPAMENHDVSEQTVSCLAVRRKLLTSSEARDIVLNSDQSLDTSDFDFSESPQKNTLPMRNKLSQEINLNIELETNTKDQKAEQIFKKDSLDTEKGDSWGNLTPIKKYKQDTSHSLELKNNECISSVTNHGHKSVERRNVHDFFKKLYSYNGSTTSPHSSYKSSSSVNLLDVSYSNCSQANISSESSETMLKIDVDFSRSLCYSNKGKDQVITECKQQIKNVEVVELSSDSENSMDVPCISMAKKRPEQRRHEDLENLKSEVEVLTDGDCCDSPSSKPVSDLDLKIKAYSLEKQSKTHCLGIESDLENDDFITDKEAEQSSNDSFTSFNRRKRFKKKMRTHCHSIESDPENDDLITDKEAEQSSNASFTSCNRRKRFKKKIRKHFFNCSDSEQLQSVNILKNNASSYKSKRSGKYSKVVVTVVDGNDSDFEEIKCGIVSDSEILETLENRASKKFKSKSKKGIKKRSISVSESKSQAKKQKTEKSKCTEIVSNDSHKEAKNKQLPTDESACHSKQRQICKPKDVFELDSSDEDSVPLGLLRSQQDFSSRKIDARYSPEVETSTHIVDRLIDMKKGIQLEKVFNLKTLNIRNKIGISNCNVTNHSRTFGQHECSRLVGPTVYGSSDSESESSFRTSTHDEISQQKLRKTNSKEENVCPTWIRNCSIGNEQLSTSSISVAYQDSDSEETSSGLSDISSLKGKNTTGNNEKRPENLELSNLRNICRTIGLILRNTKELEGCVTDEDKIKRIKELLKEKGMKGNPSLQKAEKLNLLKELRELQCRENTSNSTDSGQRRRKVNCGIFGNTQKTPRSQGIFESVFSNLRDVTTLDDSDSS